MFHDRVFAAVILSLAAASAAHAGSEDRKQPVDVSADHQESDTKAGVTHLTGNVHIDQGSIKARSDTAVIYQADGNVSRAVLNGAPATIEQKLDSGEMMHGRAKQIDYDAAKSIALMTGDAVIEQPQGEMRGEHITYEITTGKVTADGQGKDGRVYMHLVPKTDEQKAAEKAGKDAKKAADGDKPKQ